MAKQSPTETYPWPLKYIDVLFLEGGIWWNHQMWWVNHSFWWRTHEDGGQTDLQIAGGIWCGVASAPTVNGQARVSAPAHGQCDEQNMSASCFVDSCIFSCWSVIHSNPIPFGFCRNRPRIALHPSAQSKALLGAVEPAAARPWLRGIGCGKFLDRSVKQADGRIFHGYLMLFFWGL